MGGKWPSGMHDLISQSAFSEVWPLHHQRGHFGRIRSAPPHLSSSLNVGLDCLPVKLGAGWAARFLPSTSDARPLDRVTVLVSSLRMQR